MQILTQIFSSGLQLEQREWGEAWEQYEHTELRKICQELSSKKIIQNQKSKNNSYGCRDKVFYHTMVLTLQNLMFYLLKQKIETFFEDKTIWRHATIVIPVLCLQEKGDRENQHVKVTIMPSLP